MSDPTSNGTSPGAAGVADRRQVQVVRLYLKDASFEIPGAPEVFSGERNWQPQVDLQLETETRRVDEGLHEVVLSVTVTGSEQERTIFLVEIKQAGLFTIQGISKDELGPILGAYCPGILFPYAREAVSDLVQKGGLPQIVLQPVSFEALYAQRRRPPQTGTSAPDAAQ